MLGVTAEVFSEPLATVAGLLDQPRPLLKDLADEVAAYEREVFTTSDDGRWAANDPLTVALKGSARPLVDTGSLLRELTSPQSVKIGNDSVSLTTSHVGAVMAKRGARGAPVREAIPTPDREDLQGWGERFLQTLLKVLP